MELIRLNLNSKCNIKDSLVISIGEFDGVHYGHQMLINEIVQVAKLKNIKSGIVTFFPHPAFVLGKRKDDGYITTFKQKEEIFANLGVDYLIVVEFNNELSRLSYKEFEERILDQLNIDTIICGFDFKYGYQGAGDYRTLRQRYNTIFFEKIEIDDEKVSSTKIRNLLSLGMMEEASKYLKRPFSLKGKVIKGNNVGSKIGLATANLFFNNEFYMLKPGVYSTYVNLDNKKYLGVCNIGHNPSFNYVEALSVEVHILDFDKDIYDKEIEVEFIHYLRGEVKFNGVEQLLEQIEKDIKITREIL